MTKGLCTFSESERAGIAKRRVAKKTGGIGYNAALNFLNKKGKIAFVKPKKVIPS